MRAGQRETVIQDTVLRRLTNFDATDLGPHAAALYRELVSVASAGLPVATVILAAAIVDVVRHEEAGPAGCLDGAVFSFAGSAANLNWLRGRRNHLVHYEGPNDGLMGEGDASRWLTSDAERAVTALLDFLNELTLSD